MMNEKPLSPARRAGHRFLKNKLGMAALLTLAAIVFLCILVPAVSPYHYNNNRMGEKYEAPSMEHLLGTDENGRDVLTRVFYAGRISLLIALSAVALEVFLGVLIGALAGYCGGYLDEALMSLCEVLMALPFMLVAITVIAVLGAPDPGKMGALAAFVKRVGANNWKVFLLIAVLGGLGWPRMARLVRAEVLLIRGQTYMDACEVLGIPGLRRVVYHILPGVTHVVVVCGVMGFAGVILTETALSFLGLGVDLVTPTWGSLIQSARSVVNLGKRPWLWAPPGALIFITVMGFNLVGEALKDALNPRRHNINGE